MDKYVTLLGTEEVRRAASEMSSAASTMRSASGDFDSAVRQQRMNLSDHEQRMSQLLDRLELILFIDRQARAGVGYDEESARIAIEKRR